MMGDLYICNRLGRWLRMMGALYTYNLPGGWFRSNQSQRETNHSTKLDKQQAANNNNISTLSRTYCPSSRNLLNLSTWFLKSPLKESVSESMENLGTKIKF